MGGSGSGRYGAYSAAATCESHHSIDLAWLRRRNFLEVGRRSTITWSRRGQQTGSISITAQQEGLRVDYQTKDGGSEPLQVSELIPFIYTATRFSRAPPLVPVLALWAALPGHLRSRAARQVVRRFPDLTTAELSQALQDATAAAEKQATWRH